MGRPRPQLDEPAPLDNGGDRQNKDPRTGRFLPGNKSATGRAKPFAARRAEITRRLMNVPDEDVDAVIDKLIECAKDGQGWAIKELMSRWIGQPQGYKTRPASDPDFFDLNQETVIAAFSELQGHLGGNEHDLFNHIMGEG